MNPKFRYGSLNKQVSSARLLWQWNPTVIWGWMGEDAKEFARSTGFSFGQETCLSVYTDPRMWVGTRMVQGSQLPHSLNHVFHLQRCGLQLPLRSPPHPPCLRHFPGGWQCADAGVPELGKWRAISGGPGPVPAQRELK